MEKVKKEKFVRLEDIELNGLEKAIFNSLLTLSIGRKTVEELKEIGDVRANKKGGLLVEMDISEEKKVSLLFGTKWDRYEYRVCSFFTV